MQADTAASPAVGDCLLTDGLCLLERHAELSCSKLCMLNKALSSKIRTA